MLRAIAKFIGATKINLKGGPMFDGIEVFSTSDNHFHIGSRRLDEYDKSSNPNDRVYAAKIRFYLQKAGYHHGNDMIVLNKSYFQAFVDAIATFKFVPTAASAAVASVAPVSAAADPDDDEEEIKAEIEAEIKRMNANELRATERIIAFKNNEGAVEYYPADKSKTEYNFGNFKINLGDSVRTGNLHIKFVNKETIFTLTLDVNASDIISCMRTLIDKSYLGVTKITSIESVGFFPKKLEVTGVLTENGDLRRKLSTYTLNFFVQDFQKRHQECSDPATQMADLRVAGPADLIMTIHAKIDVVNTRNISDATNVKKFTELQRGLLRANNDMEVLKQIDREMDKLLEDTRHDPRRPPPSVPVNRRGVPPPSVPPGSLIAASAPPPGGGGKTRRKHRR
jgi:polyisoprenoid-binding protein YceI